MQHTPTVAEQVQAAVSYLTERCDYAESRDRQGWNAIDTHVGHLLAGLEELTVSDTVFAYRLCRNYTRQLREGGIHLPSQQEVDAYAKTGVVQDMTRAEFRAQKREETWQAHKEEARTANPDRVYTQGGRIVVKWGEYDPTKTEAMQPLKALCPKGWRYFNFFGEREWSFPKTCTEAVLGAVAPFAGIEYDDTLDEFRLEAEVEAALQRTLEERERARRQAEVAYLLAQVGPLLEGAPLPCGQPLFAHQREVVRRMLEAGRFIVAHDMGLGKTRSALVAASAYGRDIPVFVIAPASLRINWWREAEAVGLPIEVYSWAKIPPPPEQNYLLVVDEAHYAQNLQSKRTQAFLALVEGARAVFLLTGTPLKNGRPANLFPLLKACRHPLADNRRAYEIRYCAAHLHAVSRTREIWDVSGAAFLDELHAKIKDVLEYRKKEDCLDLPPKIRDMRLVEVPKAAQDAYQQTITRLRARHAAQTEEKVQALLEEKQAYLIALEAGEDPEMPDETDPRSADALVELGIVNHAASVAKAGAAIEIAEEVIGQGGQIVLFSGFRDTIAQVSAALGCPALVGGLSKEAKQEMIDGFQAGTHRAIVCSFGAGGVGITLTGHEGRAQTVVLIDRPWTPGDAEQAEDRCHRIGTRGTVSALWLQYGPADAQIDPLLQEKQERIDLVLTGKRKTMRGARGLTRDVARDILREVLG